MAYFSLKKHCIMALMVCIVYVVTKIVNGQQVKRTQSEQTIPTISS